MQITPPRHTEPLSPVASFADYVRPLIADDVTIAGIQVIKEQYESADFYRLDIRASAFSYTSFHKCSFEKASFMDVVFQDCDFSNSNFQSAYFQRCQFLSCKGIGMDMVGAMLKSVTFEDCNLRYANFNTTKFAGVRMRRTDCTEAAMAEMQLKRFAAEKSTFLRNDFHKTMLAGVDFSDNLFASPAISSPPLELRGIIVDPFQAADLVSIWGIKVKQPLPQEEPQA